MSREKKYFKPGDIVISDHLLHSDSNKGRTWEIISEWKKDDPGFAYRVKCVQTGDRGEFMSWSLSLLAKDYDPTQQPYEDGDI